MPDLINLLPERRARALRREYFLRLGTLGLLLASGLVVIHGVFLLPSYLYLSQQAKGEQQELDAAQARLAGSTEASVTSQLAALQASASYLAGLSSAPSASDAARAVLAVARPGIAITNLAVTPGKSGGAPSAIVLSGVADTREDLRAYDLALSSAPGIAKVDLPVSAYASESDISFSMTLTGTFSP